MGTSVQLVTMFVASMSVASVAGVFNTTNAMLDNIQYVGCYRAGSLFVRFDRHTISPFNLTKCVNDCKRKNYQFAAVYARRSMCYCGREIPSGREEDSRCDVPCPNNHVRTCGGGWELGSLYDINGTHAEFLTGLTHGVRLYHSRYASSYNDLMAYDKIAKVQSVDYHYTKNLSFAIVGNNLYRSSLHPHVRSVIATGNTSIVMKGSPCAGFAVDWVRDRIFWANCTSNGKYIVVSNLNGTAHRLVKNITYTVDRMEIDPYTRTLFWMSNRAIYWRELASGKEFEHRPFEGIEAFTLDVAHRRLYCLTKSFHSLYSLDYKGGSKKEHISDFSLSDVRGISVLEEKVLWVNKNGKIYEAPLNSGRVWNLKPIGTLHEDVVHVRVVSPLLQSNSSRVLHHGRY